MDSEQVQAVAEAVVKEMHKSGINGQCLCRIDHVRHNKEHDFINEAMAFFARANKVRWGVFQALAIAAAFAFFAFLGIKFNGGL